MSEIRTEAVPLVDGSDLRLTVAEPDGPARGGIVVLHEARGVTQMVQRLVEGIAGDGWLVVAPHLYHRDGTEDLDTAEHVARLEGDQVMADTDTAFGWLAEHDIEPDRMGVIGFDLGGSVALLVAARRTLGAAVTVAGGGISEPLGPLPALISAAPGLTCPWLGIYGDRDDVEELDGLLAAARESEVATDLVTYPGRGHRFDDDPATAEDAWQRMLNWFDSHLR
ncbi:dienelactone hydrolase family protein [Pseudonocardia sp. WMMC193]|uniref:dienelactone hydrolase family protein n=1 Tax=Pseudonocardia sp. WMMC193 TaxID=2911965 RepID=UPI001F1F9787|nr:dienelactone hydrolase family protein [Pseudonocardia sp. WMMC193]MCF7551770.1 dienelactone hydrolase family protein [Pseudonocardia sp. WMMC193]